MAFQAGHQKVPGSGMRKGQRTRRTQSTAEAFARVSERYGDPLDALAAIAYDASMEPSIRISGLKEICQYGYAKCKSIELVCATESTADASSLDQLLVDVERRLQVQSTLHAD